MKRIFLPVLIVLVLLTRNAQAFPEMIRHGYVNCMSCHVSPNGGGALTQYGRELSKEILSTWSTENEHQPLHGLVRQENFPSWLNTVGGDFRGLQSHYEDKNVKQGEWLWMQAEAEAGIKLWNAIKVNASVARFESKKMGHVEMRKYYVSIPISEQQHVRVGHFRPNYGLNIAEHTAFIRSDLGLGPRTESYNAEYAWINENWNYFATLAFPDGKKKHEQRERKHTQQLSYAFLNSFRLGVNYMDSSSLSQDMQAYGLSAWLGFTKKLYSLMEIDLANRRTTGGPFTKGFVLYQKVGYELFQGFHLLAIHEMAQANWDDNTTKKRVLGAGVTWFPRPHFEFQAVWNKVQIRAAGTEWADMAWLLAHYYL